MATTPIAEDFAAIRQALEKLQAERHATLAGPTAATTDGFDELPPLSSYADAEMDDFDFADGLLYWREPATGPADMLQDRRADSLAAAVLGQVEHVVTGNQAIDDEIAGTVAALVSAGTAAMCWFQEQDIVELTIPELADFISLCRLLELADESMHPGLPEAARSMAAGYLALLPGFDPARGAMQRGLTVLQHRVVESLVLQALTSPYLLGMPIAAPFRRPGQVGRIADRMDDISSLVLQRLVEPDMSARLAVECSEAATGLLQASVAATR